jgi:8-oxo-dGTP pyrophosphatase MutT (NUDIX family)
MGSTFRNVSLQRRARRTARVLLVSSDDRVLLLRGGDPQRPEAGTWWFTPGGELEPGETPAQAARRELAEETGLDHDEMGPVVLQRATEFQFDGVVYEQAEDYFLVRTEPFEVDSSRWTLVEIATVVEHRWWPLNDLRTTDATIYPEGLPEFLDGVI